MGLVLIGFFFLFDPYVSVVDVLPDFIGYALISVGLSRLRDINERMGEARRWMVRLMLLSLVRVVSLALVFSMAQAELATALLLAGFALAVLDCVALVPAFRNLTNGWTYIGSRMDGVAILSEQKTRKGFWRPSRNVTEKLGRDTVAFLLLREALAVLPEFAALASVREEGYVGMNWYEYIALFREVAVLISAVLGVIWIIKVIRYAMLIKRDTAFWTTLRATCEERERSAPHLAACRRIYTGTFCLALGAVTTVDFHVDGFDILPGFVGAGLFLVGTFLLRPCVKREWIPAAITSALCIPSFVATFLARWYFEQNSTASAVLKSEKAGVLFYGTFSVVALSEILLLASFVATAVLLYRVVRQHTGYEAVRKDDIRSQESNRLLHRYLNRRLTAAFVVGGLVSIGRVVYSFALPYLEGTRIRIKAITLMDNDALLYGADILLHIVFVMLLWTALSALRDEVRAKYRLY